MLGGVGGGGKGGVDVDILMIQLVLVNPWFMRMYSVIVHKHMCRTMVNLICHILMHADQPHPEIFHVQFLEFWLLYDCT